MDVIFWEYGLPDKEAKQRAFSQVKGLPWQKQSVRCPVAVRWSCTDRTSTGQAPDGQNTTLKDKVRTFLADSPEAAELSVRDVVLTLRTAGINAGRTTVSEVLQERKQILA